MSKPDIPTFEDWRTNFPEADELYKEILNARKNSRDITEVTGFLGDGRDKKAFRVGEQVLKVQNFRPETPFSGQVSPLRRALGVVGMEQVVAVSHHLQVIVTDYIPGSLAIGVSEQSLRKWYIKLHTVERLVGMLSEMQERGLYVEGPKNFLVGPKGFAVIDPADYPMNGLTVNHFDGVVDLVACYQAERGHVYPRSPRETTVIRNAFQAVRGHSGLGD